MTAFIFPGQGSQKVGMGADLAEASAHAREVFQEVDEALKQNLSGLMKDGPESELTMTANAQPAIMANSIATVRVLERNSASRWRTRPNVWPDIRWANIARCVLPGHFR